MQYIDSHVHLWDLAAGINSWISRSGRLDLQRNFELGDYLQANPVPLAVVTVEAADAKHSLAEVSWLEHKLSSAAIGWRHLAHIDLLLEPDLFERQLGKFAAYPSVVGFRAIYAYSQASSYCPAADDFSLNSLLLEQFQANLITLRQNDYIYSCQLYPEQLLRVLPLIVASEVNCIVDHCGLPLFNQPAQVRCWERLVEAVADSGIYVKLSGLAMNDNQAHWQHIYRRLLNQLGSDRMVFGSNYPLCQSPSECLTQLIRAMEWQGLDLAAQSAILAKNAQQLFKFSRKVNS